MFIKRFLMQNNHKDLLALFVQIILVLFKSKFCFLMHETNINKKKSWNVF